MTQTPEERRLLGAGVRFCGVGMVHADQSTAPCILPRAHQEDDSDHQDEHGHRAPVLVHQATIRAAQALQDERDAAGRADYEREQAIAGLAGAFMEAVPGRVVTSARARQLAGLAWVQGWRPPESG